jgi:hypothetical protein
MWSYDGLVRRVECEVQERVWGALTSSQASKVTSFYNSAHDEAWFFYPSGGSTENDRYVHVNVLTGYWFTGALDRTCACDKGVFRYPMAVCTSRHVHEHEVPGGGYGATAPYVLTGPYELDAERRVLVSRVYPDSLGNGTLTFYGQDTPKAEPLMLGSYAAGARTDLLFSAQEVSMRYDFTASTDRMGTFRVMARPQGRF